MDPIASLVKGALEGLTKGINDYIQAQQARKDITDLEKKTATIIAQGYINAGQKWLIDALLNPDQHDFLLDSGGKLEPDLSARTGSPVVPGPVQIERTDGGVLRVPPAT